jgi:hypothetical protein
MTPYCQDQTAFALSPVNFFRQRWQMKNFFAAGICPLILYLDLFCMIEEYSKKYNRENSDSELPNTRCDVRGMREQ